MIPSHDDFLVVYTQTLNPCAEPGVPKGAEAESADASEPGVPQRGDTQIISQDQTVSGEAGLAEWLGGSPRRLHSLA